MTDLLKYLDSLSPFLQGVLGSAVLAFITWLGRLALHAAQKGGSVAFKFVSRDLMMKHILHKQFVQSRRLPEAIWGNFFVITQSLQWSIIAASSLIFVFAVSSLLEGKWLHLLGYYLALNSLLEAHSWLKDRSDEKHIAYLDPEIKKELIAKYYPKEAPTDEAIQANPPLNVESQTSRTS
jgi:hypothetical protein